MTDVTSTQTLLPLNETDRSIEPEATDTSYRLMKQSKPPRNQSQPLQRACIPLDGTDRSGHRRNGRSNVYRSTMKPERPALPSAAPKSSITKPINYLESRLSMVWSLMTWSSHSKSFFRPPAACRKRGRGVRVR